MTENNKVVYDGQTLIDLTQDDVTQADVRQGVYFHDASGVRSQGTMIQSDEIFWAEYGTTTSAEIESAYQDGKEVCCVRSNRIYYLVYRDSATKHDFHCPALGNGYRISCDNDSWTYGTLAYITTATATPTANTVSKFDSSAHMNSTDMSSQEVEDFVDGLNVSRINELITVESFSNSVTLSNSDYAVGSIDVSKTGYTPLGVVQVKSAANTVIFVVTTYYLNGNTLNYTLRRINGATTTTETSTFTVLYVFNP